MAFARGEGGSVSMKLLRTARRLLAGHVQDSIWNVAQLP